MIIKKYTKCKLLILCEDKKDGKDILKDEEARLKRQWTRGLGHVYENI